MPLPWDDFAHNYGYADEKSMWIGLFGPDNPDPPSKITIAHELGVAPETIRNRLLRCGFKKQPRRGGNNFGPFTTRKWNKRANRLGFENEKKMLEHYRFNYSALQKEFNVSNTTIRSRFRKHGIRYFRKTPRSATVKRAGLTNALRQLKGPGDVICLPIATKNSITGCTKNLQIKVTTRKIDQNTLAVTRFA